MRMSLESTDLSVYKKISAPPVGSAEECDLTKETAVLQPHY